MDFVGKCKLQPLTLFPTLSTRTKPKTGMLARCTTMDTRTLRREIEVHSQFRPIQKSRLAWKVNKTKNQKHLSPEIREKKSGR